VEERKNSPQNIMNSQPVIAGEEKKNWNVFPFINTNNWLSIFDI
jgi:hypothetical protein